MRILVTGGAGYLGCRVVPLLLQAGHRVTAVDTMDHGGEGLLGVADHSRLVIAARDAGQLRPAEIAGHDAAVHLAALVGEAACRADEQRARSVNFVATRHLAVNARHLILASTCSNYGIHDGLATEDSPLNPKGLYAETKCEAERIVLDAGGTVLRLATLWGPSPRMRFDLMVNEAALRVATNRGAFEVYAPSAYRPWLHIADAAQVFQKAVLGQWGGVWNVVGENTTKGEIGHMVHRAGGQMLLNAGASDPRDYQVDGSKLAKIFAPMLAPRTLETWLPRLVDAVRTMRDPGNGRYRNAA